MRSEEHTNTLPNGINNFIEILGASFGVVGGAYLIQEGVKGFQNNLNQIYAIIFLALGVAGILYGILGFRKIWIKQTTDIRNLKRKSEGI